MSERLSNGGGSNEGKKEGREEGRKEREFPQDSPERHVDDAVMRERRHDRERRALLPTAHRRRRDEDAGVLAVVAARLPLLAGTVPEGLPLGGEVAETGRDPHEEGIVLLELVGRDQGHGGGVLPWRVHLREDLLREGLRYLEEVGFAAGGFDAAPFGLGDLVKVPVHGVLLTIAVIESTWHTYAGGLKEKGFFGGGGEGEG